MADHKRFVTSHLNPTGTMEPPIFVIAEVNLETSDCTMPTHTTDEAEAREMLETYAFARMAQLAATDPSRPCIDSVADRHPDPSLRSPVGPGLNALGCGDEIPTEHLRPGEYVVYFEPEAERVALGRMDEERIFLGRRPHPDDEDYAEHEDPDVVVDLRYFTLQRLMFTINKAMTIRTELTDALQRDEMVLPPE